MEPLTIAGAVVGSVLNVLMPAWLLCVMLVLLLGGTTIKTLGKGVRLYRKESAAMEASADYHKLAAGDTLHADTEAGRPGAELRALLDEESVHSVPKILCMLLTTVGTLAFTILKVCLAPPIFSLKQYLPITASKLLDL